MQRINWKCFFDNSSTTDALIDFANRKYSFKQFSKASWTAECKASIKIMKQRGYQKSIAAAQKACRKWWGSDWKDDS